MGDASIIARLLANGHVQYGWGVEMEGILAWWELDCYYVIKSLKM